MNCLASSLSHSASSWTSLTWAHSSSDSRSCRSAKRKLGISRSFDVVEGSSLGHGDLRNALGASCSQRCPPRPSQSLARRPVKRIGNQSKESEAGGGDGDHKTGLDAHSLTDRSNGHYSTEAGKGEDGLGQSSIGALVQ